MQNLIVTVLGRKGCGKSTLVREITREWKRVVILDYLGEYGSGIGATVHEGLRASVAALVHWSPRPRFCCSLRVDDLDDALDVLEVAGAMRDYLLVVEEASWICSASHIPSQVARLVRYGRHHGISQLYVAQRPTMVHRDVTSQSDVIVSFQQHEQRDVAYLSSILGADADRLPQLPQFAIVAGPTPARFPAAVRRRLKATPVKRALDSERGRGVARDRKRDGGEDPATE
jgi:hypothetical protein